MIPLLPTIAEVVVLPVLVALGGWVLTLLPGPARTVLSSIAHDKRMALLTGALSRAAYDLLPALASGQMNRAAAVDFVAGYVNRNLPEVLAELRPDKDTLRRMANAAIEAAKQGKPS
jgi:hypothetical protein